MVNAQCGTGPTTKRTPKWKREARIFRRDGLVRYVRGAWLLRRFYRSLKNLGTSS